MLSAPILIGGALISASALAYGVRRLDYERIPQAAVLAAAFFVSSLFSVPIGPSSAHLLLNGLMGLVLGWSAIPTIAIALLLQAVFFGFGGLLVLGVNILNVALPALVCALTLRPWLHHTQGQNGFLIGTLAGAVGVLLTALLLCGSLALSGAEFIPAAKVILLTYLPLAVVEAAICGFVLRFILKVSPELLLPSSPDQHRRRQTGTAVAGCETCPTTKAPAKEENQL
ncbi:cobalt transporter CbiM [Aestuariirhabdus sp. Z084]|nr:cobalt transporter CbiM [Aestuariirhabdus haliotis]MCL6420668.1 cobalt transporter CbiM [Aestuariirhabdus haliotis]